MARPKKIKEVPITNESVQPIVEEVINIAPKAVTLQGKTVNQKIQGKARLFNVDRQKIITGWIPIEIAKDIVKQNGHIIINDESKG